MSEGESTGKFTDASDPIFTMYNETAEEEDRKMAESWKADADRILVFVSYIALHITNTALAPMGIDWSVLRCSCNLSCGLDTGPSTESTG
jgi:hypothetical protein